MKITKSMKTSLSLAAAMGTFALAAANGATTIMDTTTRNGSFETTELWVNSFAETAGAPSYETNFASEGTRSMRIRGTSSTSGEGTAQNTEFVVSATVAFNLSFDWNARANWLTTDAIAYTLFTTSDNTSSGTITTIAEGSVDGNITNTAVTINESFTGIGTVAGASVGQQLWIEFAYDLSSYAVDKTTDANARVDNVVLTAIAVPEPSSAALLGLGGLALILRRRK